MNKDYIMDGNRIADCKENVARMSVWELIRFRLPRDVDMAGVLRALLDLVEPVWFLMVRTLGLMVFPLLLVLLPFIADKEIRLARRFVARMEAEKTGSGSIEVHRTNFERFKGRRFKCWAYNVLVDSFPQHQLVGIPSFDYAQQDRQTGDMVFYRLKKDNTEVSDEVEKPEET